MRRKKFLDQNCKTQPPKILFCNLWLNTKGIRNYKINIRINFQKACLSEVFGEIIDHRCKISTEQI